MVRAATLAVALGLLFLLSLWGADHATCKLPVTIQKAEQKEAAVAPIHGRAATGPALLVASASASGPRIPSALPRTEAIARLMATRDAEIFEETDGQVQNSWEVYDYILGFYSSVDQCLGARPMRGELVYQIGWRTDDDGTQHADGITLLEDLLPEGRVPLPEADITAFMDCASSYLGQRVINQESNPFQTWGMDTHFPLEEEWVVLAALKAREEP